MAKRFMLYLRAQEKPEDGYRVFLIDDDVSKSMWPDGCIYFSVHKVKISWHVEIYGLVKEEIRLDKFVTIDPEFVKQLINDALKRIQMKGCYISITSPVLRLICKEALAILEERNAQG